MSQKIRIGNDIDIRWSLFDADEHPYNLDGRNISIELNVNKKRVKITDIETSGNTVHFIYYGKDQKHTGSYILKFIENDGLEDMVTFDTKDAFTLVEHSWLAIDEGETPETIQLEFVTISSELNERVGPKGDSAGFGEVTASVDDSVGTPSVVVTTSGPDTAKNFDFAFHNLKGQPATANDGKLTIKKNGVSVGSFTANSASDVEVNIEVPNGTVQSVAAGSGLAIAGDSSVNPTVKLADGRKLPTNEEWAAKAPLASPSFTGVPTGPTAASGNVSAQLATTEFVHNEISALDRPVVYKGTLGIGGTITALPAASASNEGWEYKVITDGTYAGQQAKLGDLFISNGSEWSYVPSGDEPSGDVTGPDSSTDKHLAVFNGASGKVIEDGGILVGDIALKSEVLTKTNTDAYTPSANYHPATKKYVDDNICKGWRMDDMSSSGFTVGEGRFSDEDAPIFASLSELRAFAEGKYTYVTDASEIHRYILIGYENDTDSDPTNYTFVFADENGLTYKWESIIDTFEVKVVGGKLTLMVDDRYYTKAANVTLENNIIHITGATIDDDTALNIYGLRIYDENGDTYYKRGKIVNNSQEISLPTSSGTLALTSQIPDGTVTSVGAGTGLSISGNQSINPTVNVATGYKLPTTAEWNGKQDAIADLEEIRSNAEHGAAADVKITAAQTKIAWLDEFKWTDEQVWPKKSGGGGGDAKALRTMPTFSKRGRPKFDNCVFYVSHPMMDEEGAEIVLMHYAKRNGKKNLETEEHSNFPKKGFCLAIGGLASGGYFAFSAETQYSDFYDFCDGQLSEHNLGSLFGIALRIPNPDYNGPSTRLKTAVYKGVPESLYSDVLPIRISYDGDNDYWGIGLA